MTKSKSSQTLHSSCDQCLTWSEKHWTSQILPYRWPNGPGSHLGIPRHVWDWFVRFWFFSHFLHCCVGGWPFLAQKSSHSLPYRWPMCPSSHPQLTWTLDWGPGQLSAWSERISISVENLSMFKSSQTLHSSVPGLIWEKWRLASQHIYIKLFCLSVFPVLIFWSTCSVDVTITCCVFSHSRFLCSVPKVKLKWEQQIRPDIAGDMQLMISSPS